ncbi:hypothetical protein I553_7047 [Mycobacterium xenopi 4042]|uniref:Uncharacterized protein n=1 Tax=Mycobacterium xenopi 4042 TaxID=1299334 RepID=X7Z386_MYCXE|nr:hypothetical protein I553_7047 [Mycobacterium xenopi 4042]
MTAALATSFTAIADSLAAADIVIADSELENLLQRADAAKPRSRQSLAAYLMEQATPWTTPNPHCPYAFARMAYLLWQSDYPVQPVACAQCGRITPKLDRVIDGARCCGWCASRRTQHICERCGRLGHRVTTTETGGLCRRCYQKDPARRETCGGCGQSHVPSKRTAEGLPLCGNCARPNTCALVAAALTTPRSSPAPARYASGATTHRHAPAASAAPSAPSRCVLNAA